MAAKRSAKRRKTKRSAPVRSRTRLSSVFVRLGVRPVINCCGIYTDLGGSVLSPAIWAAATELNQWYVRMTDLLDSTGEFIAKLVGAEAARVTPGASAAIALAVGATMTGEVGERWEQLPSTEGLKSEVLISAAHLRDYKYAICARMPGARLVPVGPQDRYDRKALLDGITPATACILVPAHLLDGFSGVAQLAALVAEADSRGVPVVVDAAYMSYPVDLISRYARCGAALTCFSAKYFGGPNPGGFVSINNQLVTTPAQVVAAVDGARKAGRSSVLLLVKRGTTPELYVGVGITGK